PPGADGQRLRPVRDDPGDVPAEVHDDSSLGPELRDRRERRPGVRAGREQLARDADVRRGGDRQELGEPLHDPQDDRFPPGHEATRYFLTWRYRDSMRLTRLGATGLTVSSVGLGTLTWGRDTDEHDAAEHLEVFLDAGGTLVDTA